MLFNVQSKTAKFWHLCTEDFSVILCKGALGKGAPARESRTSTRLVSPAAAAKKKK